MEKKRVGIWIRVSTDDQARGESPEHHQKRAEAYAEAKGWEVVTVYHLEGVSGKTVMDHKEAIRMMREVRSGKIQGLIFSKLARLARSTKQLLEFSEYFRQYGADLISLQESIDTSSPAGRLFYTLIAAMAQWEREEITERVVASVPIRAQMGKSLGGFAPYGYAWDNKQLVLNEEEAAIRKHLYDLFLQYKRKKTVAKKMNELGYRTRKGNRFTDTSIDRMLRDPISKGLRRVNYTKSMGKDKQWVMKPEEEWIFVPVPAIVAKEVWEEANAILEEQTTRRKRKAKIPSHLFSGYIECSCGGKMYVPSNSPKYTCKACRNKIPESDMEAIFHERLKHFLTSEEETRRAMEDLVGIIEEREKLIEERKSVASKLKQKLDSLVELYQEGEIPKDGFKDHYQPIYDQLQQVKEAIPILEGEVDHLINSIQSTDTVFHEARNLYAKWEEKSFEEKRQIIEEILEGIVVSDSEVQIRLKNIRSISSFQSDGTLATHPGGVTQKDAISSPELPLSKLYQAFEA